MTKLTKGLIALAVGLSLSLTAQASLNTGVDLTGNADNNWTVGFNGAGADPAFVLSTGGGFPTGPWLSDNSVSKWVTPHETTQMNPGVGLWTYEIAFDLASVQPTSVRWASDNSSFIRVNTVQGVNTAWNRPAGDSFTTWNEWLDITDYLQVGANTVQVWVANLPGAGNNPTGMRFEVAPVPEPTTILAGALLLLPFGASAFRTLRKRHSA